MCIKVDGNQFLNLKPVIFTVAFYPWARSGLTLTDTGFGQVILKEACSPERRIVVMAASAIVGTVCKVGIVVMAASAVVDAVCQVGTTIPAKCTQF